MKPSFLQFLRLTDILAAVFYSFGFLMNTASAQFNPYAYNSVGPYFYRGTGSVYISGNTSGNLIYTNKGSLTLEGTLPGSLVNDGRFTPGLGLQPYLQTRTLKILHDFTQHSSGVLKVELASNKQFDRLEIGRQAKLDGTLQIVSLNGYKAQAGDSLKILTAGDGVKGTFSKVDQRLSLTLFEVVYLSNAVELQIAGTQLEPVLELLQGTTDFELTPNQKAVAKAVDVSAKVEPLAEAVTFLASENIAALPNDLDLIAPEEMSALFEVARANAEVHLQSISGQLAAARAGANGFVSNLPTTQPDGKADADPENGKDAKEGKDILVSVDGNLWSVWMTGSGDFVDVGDDFNARGFDFQTGSISIGMDYRFSPSLILGVAGSYARTDVDLSNDGNIDVDGGRLAVYGTWYAGGAYVNAVVGGGKNSYDIHRAALEGFANGDTDGGELDALLGAGYDFKNSFWTFGPTASIGYVYENFDSFQEGGSLLPLNFSSRVEESLRTRLGGHVQTNCKAGNVKIVSELSLEWQHDYSDTNPSIEAGFANLRGPTFTTRGPNIGTDAAIVGASISVEWNVALVTYLRYEAEVGRENYDRQTISAGVRWSF